MIVTTTSLRLHPENETRMLSLTITDTRDQTAAVFRALAQETNRAEIDLTRWQALQTWLATGPNGVVIPFADRLAGLVPPLAVRLRRDFKTVLTLIRAHALLHRASRPKDEQGRVIAEIEDYQVVRELIADLVAVGVEATVKREVREVVDMVRRLLDEGREDVRQADLKSVLKLDKSAVSRRVAEAVDAGFLRNLEDRKGRPARLVEMHCPITARFSPHPSSCSATKRCAVARLILGIRHPLRAPSTRVICSKPNKARRLGFPGREARL